MLITQALSRSAITSFYNSLGRNRSRQSGYDQEAQPAIMRLLHTTTLKLHEFFGSQIPYYAILSRRWGIEEVTLQDLQQERESSMAGWQKVVGCCAQARKDGWEYAVSTLDFSHVNLSICVDQHKLIDTSGLTPAI